MIAQGVLAIALQVAAAAGQDQPPAPPPADAQSTQDESTGRIGVEAQTGGGDVVVTARRRAESVQRVPIAMSVIGGSAIAETGAYNVNRLTQLQPSLQFYSTNPRNSAANIRGLGAPFGLTNDGIEQGVGIYVDQVYYSRIASATFDFTDTDRIEVLRGPQGTLYGKNTTAGAINISTRAPSFEPEGRVEITGGNYDFFQGKASFSTPIKDDVLAVRISTSITTRRGTIYNVRTNTWLNSQDNQSFRGQLLFKPTANFSATLYADYNLQNPSCCVQYYARVGTTQRSLGRQYAALAAAFGYSVPSTNPFDRVTDVDTPLQAHQDLGGVSLVANWDVGPGTLTSVSAWRFWNWSPSNDRDFIGLPITTVSQNPSQQNQYTQEFRYASNGNRRLDYVLGAFLFYQTIETQGLQVQGSAASRYLLSGASASDPSILNGLTATNAIGFSNTSAALFGKLTWHVTDRFAIAPGIRLNYDQKRGDYVSVVTTGTGSRTLTSDQRGVLAPQEYHPRFHDWNVSGDINFSYDFSNFVHGYVTYSRATKSGGINLSGLPLDANNNPILSSATVKPEQVNDYEIGLKTQLAGGRATVNIAGFWTDIFDYQATVTNGQLGVLRGYLANAGQVRTRGIEVDSALRATQRLNLYANGTFTDAKYVKFVDAPCPPELSGGTAVDATHTVSAPGVAGGNSPANCNISGQWLPGVSKWAFSYGAEYDLPGRAFGLSGQFYLGYDGSYRSKFSANPSRSIYTDIDGYALSNFRLGFKSGTRLNAFAWVRNAFDQNYFELLALQSGNTGLVVGQPGDPRTFGGTISLGF
jgi:iron complex outermembrane recepter protein